MTDTAQVVCWTLSVSQQCNSFSVASQLQSKPIVNPCWVMLIAVCPSIIPSQLFLPHLLLYCLSHTASHHLMCVPVWQRGGWGSLTLLAVTIHPWMDLTVHLSHVQSLALETGNRRKRTTRSTRDQKISVGFLSWWTSGLQQVQWNV